ncbi:MAG: hypothetical protein JXK07_09885 [Spirochaetes bacterium]|nr:hypothetical protein [Spirochaetota bacterium]
MAKKKNQRKSHEGRLPLDPAGVRITNLLLKDFIDLIYVNNSCFVMSAMMASCHNRNRACIVPAIVYLIWKFWFCGFCSTLHLARRSVERLYNYSLLLALSVKPSCTSSFSLLIAVFFTFFFKKIVSISKRKGGER